MERFLRRVYSDLTNAGFGNVNLIFSQSPTSIGGGAKAIINDRNLYLAFVRDPRDGYFVYFVDAGNFDHPLCYWSEMSIFLELSTVEEEIASSTSNWVRFFERDRTAVRKTLSLIKLHDARIQEALAPNRLPHNVKRIREIMRELRRQYFPPAEPNGS